MRDRGLADEFVSGKPATTEFIDGVEYDGKKPLEYISKFKIGLKDPS